MSIIAAGTTTTTALSSTGNTDGTLQLQVNGTTPSVTLNTLGAIGVGSTPSYGTAGQVLTSGGSTAAPTWSSVGSSQWTTSGSNIYYNTGNVGIGRTPVTYGSFKVLDVAGASGAIQKWVHTGSTVELQAYASSSLTAVGSATNHPLTLVTNDTERVRIDTSGVITQTKSSAIILALGTGTGQVSSTGTIAIASEGLGTGADTRSGIMFRGRNTSGTLVDMLELSGATGATVAKSLGVGATTPSTSGFGITFPATQSASSDANTLDDYEEGTWTPSVGGGATYNEQKGSYIKIGQLVYVHCYLNINAINAGSTTTISGLPFNVRASAADRNQAGSVNFFNNLATSLVSLYCQPISSSTTVNFPGLTSATNNITNPLSIFRDNVQIYFSATYQTNT